MASLDALNHDILICIFTALSIPEILLLRQVGKTPISHRVVSGSSFCLIVPLGRHLDDFISYLNNTPFGRLHAQMRSSGMASRSQNGLSQHILPKISNERRCVPINSVSTGDRPQRPFVRSCPPLAEPGPYKRLSSFLAVGRAGLSRVCSAYGGRCALGIAIPSRWFRSGAQGESYSMGLLSTRMTSRMQR